MTIEEIKNYNKIECLIKKFVQIYITRDACFGCPYKPKMSMCENYEGCFKRMQEVLNDR